jgi:hypothetical protein
LPISLTGLGVREAAFIYFFGQRGLDSSIAVAASLLGYAIVVPMAVACGIVSLFVGPRVARPGLLKLWAWRIVLVILAIGDARRTRALATRWDGPPAREGRYSETEVG